jgi:ABC-2 type transport system permease protein
MNTKMIGILIRKDVRLLLTPVLFYMAVGIASIGMMGIERHVWFYGGSVLLITSLIALGFHPTMATVVGERKEQTLAFVMSMPITPTDYTSSKLAANLMMFFVPWTLLFIGCVTLISMRPSMADGLIPFTAILFGAIASGAVLILAVAIVSESLQLTIATQIACNLAFQGVMYGASNAASIKAIMQGDTVVWNTSVMQFLGTELAIALVALAATLWLQSRKTDFI